MIEIPLAIIMAYTYTNPMNLSDKARILDLMIQLEEIQRQDEQRRQHEKTFMPRYAEHEPEE